MKQKLFSGDYFEVGKQQGKIYKERGMNLNNIKIDQTLYRNQLKIYQKHYPQLIEELKGIAEGGNFDVDKVIYHFITAELRNHKRWIDKACTIFGFKTDKTLYIGRNYDWLPETEKIFEIYKIKNPKANNFVAISDGGYGAEAGLNIKNLFYNADDAINDKGLFIGLTFAYGDQSSFGLSCIHMNKLIIETCKTVEEALEIFKNVPLCAPKNFFIADSKGKMAVVEHTSKKFKIVYPKDNILIQTNHFVDETLAKEELVLKKIPIHNTYLRYFETLQGIGFNKNNFNFGSLIKILGRKGSYTCQNFPGVKTIWSLSLDMQNKRYELIYNLFGKRKVTDLKI